MLITFSKSYFQKSQTQIKRLTKERQWPGLVPNKAFEFRTLAKSLLTSDTPVNLISINQMHTLSEDVLSS